MTRLFAAAVLSVAVLHAGPAAALNPGLYEYTMKVDMPGVAGGIPPQTIQRCLTAKDVEGIKAVEMPQAANSDCKVRDQVLGGGRFSYKIACTTPQKLDGEVTGTATATSLNMDMTMRIPDVPGPMMQNIAARRIGDCR